MHGFSEERMADKKKKKQLAILGVLKATDRPVSSAAITAQLQSLGQEISERTVRLYLQVMDHEGWTRTMGKRGRLITQRGLRELDASRIIERVGFLSAKIDQITYRMPFDLARRTGSVVVNYTLASPQQFLDCSSLMRKVFEDGYGMGSLVSLLGPGERSESLTVPDGMVAVGTVCSVTLNGVLLKHGVPTHSRFGGLLELRDRQPTRFVEIITYDGTSIDPLEVFIRSGMTDYVGATQTGNGRIGASFREFPTDSRGLVLELADKLDRGGLGGFMEIGFGGQALLEIPVSEGRSGAIVIGGLNPVAILEETGVRVYSRAMAGLVDFSSLFRYEDLESRLMEYV